MLEMPNRGHSIILKNLKYNLIILQVSHCGDIYCFIHLFSAQWLATCTGQSIPMIIIVRENSLKSKDPLKSLQELSPMGSDDF